MSSAATDPISPETLGRLHPEAMTDPGQIEVLLNFWKRSNTPLRRGTNRAVKTERATIVNIGREYAVLECIDFGSLGDFLFLSAEFQGVQYFCNVQVRDAGTKSGARRLVKISKPGVVYRAERRDRERKKPRSESLWVKFIQRNGQEFQARVVDQSGDGLGVVFSGDVEIAYGEGLTLENRSAGPSKWAIVRSQRNEESPHGWRRLGLSVTPIPRGPSLRSERASEVLGELGGLVRGGNESILPEDPTVVDFRDHRAEKIVGLLDHFGPIEGAPSVLIPTAWGRTKETLAGLSATILATFAEADRPVSVLRFDGIRKQGESHNDKECLNPNFRNLNYTFTQGATDLLAAARFIQEDRGAGPIVIVSFSVASVEARRAIVLDRAERFGGWVSIVGATDPQSLIRVISGGIDYLGGAERGIRFGRQEIHGMLLDIDRTAEEALSSKIAFLDDARRDFAAIRCPVTWISGSNDAWTNPSRIADVLAFGQSSNRRLIVSDTGHQLRNSDKAAEIFGLVASECARMIGDDGSIRRPVTPEPKSLKKRQSSERRRLRRQTRILDLRSFWRDYLLGHDTGLGMELLAATSSYISLMREQIKKLDLACGQSVVDLGSGVSTFERAVHELALDLPRLDIIAVDYVFEAMLRGRCTLPPSSKLKVSHVVADLDLNSLSGSIPLARNSADRVIASLFLNYIREPEYLLTEILSLLRPSGRMVLSVLRRDADTSKICVNGMNELRTGQGLVSFGRSRESEINRSLGIFINNAARLLDLEEQGVFRFWDKDELEAAVLTSGFIEISTTSSFGDPAQAWIITAVRPA